ncbi:nuclear receptor coactivator 5-like isoform X2 [Acipenser ruthenus]|uniref:nuclear receptor coactivator 5-like isoform X2 n=1 Tax=Acipenser ruthenus TaxID=7906 RepID=UPI00145ADFDC|nr:nuclear receptor coactivator 5-like isoform X2 [Acipenser ruthenus]XP_033903292.3 nuclear receptor coactivator 5-like isoform X2 [Acipenser ruthenus]
MSRRKSRSGSPSHHTTNSNDPRDLERRIFVGNLPTNLMERKDLQELFMKYGKINALSMFRGYGFVQFERIDEAESAKAGENGRIYKGYKLDINMAAERRQHKAQSRQSPPRRELYTGYGDEREVQPRSRSPVRGREPRDHRDTREPRDREPRSTHSREHDPRDPHFDRYRADGREKEARVDPRDPALRDEAYERYYRMDEYYRRKEEPFMDRSRDPWNGRREPEAEPVRPDNRRRDELYRQYYEELQRRYDAERAVDCSVIVVNKQQKEYAETVGRQVRDLGMVVDLIFLNTEVSLTQALEDVGRASTPFAIIITQQHQVHRSCTVNILYGTPQEHRNMPIQDAMVLVAHNYDLFKVENRDKEREEIARKAAKMADEVLMREHEREGHPISLQPVITLLSEGRYLTLDEMDRLISYLRDKRERLFRTSSDPHSASRAPASASGVGALEPPPPSSQSMSTASHLPPPQTSNPQNTANHQQELQAKILSLFNSGAPPPGVPPPSTQGYGSSMSSQNPGVSQGVPPPSMSKMPTSASQVPSMMQAMNPRAALRPPVMPPGVPPPYGPPPGRMSGPSGGAGVQRSSTGGSGINFDNPSVQKALDTLIQSGPSINHLVSPGSQQGPRPGQGMGQGMGQAPTMGHYPRHY